MANNKRIFTIWETAKTLYAVVEFETDGNLLDSTDGVFKAVPTSMFNSLTADVTQTTYYKLDESRQSWTKGNYNINIYLQTGGSPVIANDILISSGVLRILDWGGIVGNVGLDRGEYIGQYTPFAMWKFTDRSVTALNNIIMGMVTDAELALDANDTSVTIVEGDTPTLTITLGRDITGDTVKLYVKTNIDDPDGAAIVNRAMTVDDVTNGVVSIKLTAVESDNFGNKYAEVNLDDGAGTILTAAQFRLNIIKRVKD
jgi:hypothetical protein